jgi:hypothetical protein
MRGLPQINTKEDVYNMLKDFPVEGKKHLKNLYDNRFIWKTTGNLTTLDEGVNDETHRAFATKDDTENEVIVQQELEVDQNAFIYRLGFTDEEIERIFQG